MKKNRKKIVSKPSSERGISKVVLVILGVIAIPIVLFLGVFLYNFVQLFFFGGPTLKGNPSASDFQKIENAVYTFYYPNGYTQGDLDKEESNVKEILSYKNPKTRATDPEEILLRTQKGNNTKPLSSLSFDQCKKIGETYRRTESDDIKTEVASGGYGDGKGVGCKLTVKYKIPGVNDASVFVEKQLWDPTAIPTTLYMVRAIFFENAGSSQAKILESAVDQFTLK